MSDTVITVRGSKAALEHALVKGEQPLKGVVPVFDREWCGQEDSNFHGLSPTTTSTLRVYQFRHGRTLMNSRANPAAGSDAPLAKRFRHRNG